jgi:multicomponent Na+:H+ antiporter subunit A
MLIAVCSGFLLALLAPWLFRLLGKGVGWLAALLAAGLAVYFGTFVGAVADGATIEATYPWAADLGIRLAFHLDGLSMLFALLITGMGAIVAVYTLGYLGRHPQLGVFYAYLLMFMASMLGLVLADNLILLSVFWELTTISSFLLIGFEHEKKASRQAALQALLVTAVGGLALLAGLVLIGLVGGTFAISELVSDPDAVVGHGMYVPILLLVLAGAFTKSAQFPFHFWLPSAMEAPTPVSAYLHSATMVKAGVYLLARLHPLLGGTDWWMGVVTPFGAVTMLLGAWLAFRSSDLKQILAYATVSVLGTLVMLLGIGTETAIIAAMVMLLAHGLYKGGLFFVAGAVDHEAGTREIDKLRGLWRAMPLTALGAALGALSMAGFMPFFGFISKEEAYKAAEHAPAATYLIIGTLVVTKVLLVAAAGLVAIQPFVGRRTEAAKAAHEASATLWLGPLLLGVAGLAFGLFPQTVGRWLVAPSAEAALGGPVETDLKLWHGVNVTLVLSILTLASGLIVYAVRGSLRKRISIAQWLATLQPEHLYHHTIAGLNWLARWQTQLLQNGYLRYYLLTILITSAGLLVAGLAQGAEPYEVPAWSKIGILDAVLVAIVVMAAVLTASSRSQLCAVLGLGAVGYAVAAVFVVYGAPDLAITQFAVETLSVILLVLVLHRLPDFRSYASRWIHLRDASVALISGGTVTALLLFAVGARRHPPISDYYAEMSVPEGHGHNIVNVILVDFRALDTLGEITVLAVAGAGVYALLKLRREKPAGGARP